MKITVLIISAMFMFLSCDSDSVNTPSETEQVEPLEGIFVLGSVDGNVGYWYDGEWNNGPVPASGNSLSISSIYVEEDKVYMAGYEYTKYDKRLAGYCIDNEWILIETDFSSVVIDIVVSNGNVYCSGILQGLYACYWDNGELILPDSIEKDDKAYGEVNCLNVENDDVIAAGDIDMVPVPVYWLNENPVQLSNPDGGIMYGSLEIIKRIIIICIQRDGVLTMRV